MCLITCECKWIEVNKILLNKRVLKLLVLIVFNIK